MKRETYRGVALKVTPRGLGQVEEFVGGVSQGVWRGTEDERMESLKRWVNAAGERPDAYGECWHPTIPEDAKSPCEKTEPHPAHDWIDQTGVIDYEHYWCVGVKP